MRPTREDSRRGVTLVEVVVALLLLAVGAFALAAAVAGGERSRREALSRGLALAAAEGWMEAWRSAPWPGEATGVEEVRWATWLGRIEWRTELRAPCLLEVRVEAGPAGGPATVVLASRRFREREASCGP